MGYNVEATAVEVTIPAAKLPEALAALKALNQRDDLKTGGSSTGEKWFAWMDPDYDKNLHTVEDIMQEVGFQDNEMTAEGFRLGWYDSKTGGEEHFLRALAPFVDEGSYVEWEGEDRAKWRNVFRGGEMLTQTGTVTYEED
ncbi:hypothetical protein FDH86_gp068 [Arthrobacter phage Tank]|uniref:Uncharacterized protein n=1 Tax=Arthrobacter phage Tank TaxID=1772319 RepID=A0A0U4JV67_9CAUD|nr:hypothetical protein FDH86_gp068 [Arthrobacter phage Tank]ALY10603.1 hypothetical protein TANK_68 [Arthrobacter phage Tank]